MLPLHLFLHLLSLSFSLLRFRHDSPLLSTLFTFPSGLLGLGRKAILCFKSIHEALNRLYMCLHNGIRLCCTSQYTCESPLRMPQPTNGRRARAEKKRGVSGETTSTKITPSRRCCI